MYERLVIARIRWFRNAKIACTKKKVEKFQSIAHVYARVCAGRWFETERLLSSLSVAFPRRSSVPSDGPEHRALSINVVSAHQPPAWHDRPSDPRRNIFGQYLCKTPGLTLSLSPSFSSLSLLSPPPLSSRDVGNMVIKIDPCFPSNLSKQLTCKQHDTLLRSLARSFARASFVSIVVRYILDSSEICIKLIRKYPRARRDAPSSRVHTRWALAAAIFMRAGNIRRTAKVKSVLGALSHGL